MRFKGVPDGRPNVSLQRPEIFDRFRSQNYLKTHSGYIIAKLLWSAIEEVSGDGVKSAVLN